MTDELLLQEERNRRLEEAKKRKEKVRAIRAKHRTTEASRDEVAELEATPLPEHDPSPAKHFNPLPEDVYKSHRQLEEIARMYGPPVVIVRAGASGGEGTS